MKAGKRITEMAAYSPILPVDILAARLGVAANKIIKLDANENPYGPSPLVREALNTLDLLHIYPDPESRTLRASLSDVHSVPMENLMAGSGADELIDLLVRVLLEPGDCVINCVPTFGMYNFDTILNYGTCISIPRKADFSLDLAAVEDAVKKNNPKIIFLCSPNNPDGRLMSTEEIAFFLDQPALIVLDEAYVEFTQQDLDLGIHQTLIRQVAERENLVVLRTFSKWAGLAGLRIGFGAFPTWMMNSLWKAKQPYNINVAASAAAVVSLQDRHNLAVNVNRIQEERSRLFQKLQGFPAIKPYPSQSNFILCKSEGTLALQVKNELASRGVFIRHYDNSLLNNFFRISVGRPEDTDELVRQLEGIL
jgi:histidinol-phosphate aminotransferase